MTWKRHAHHMVWDDTAIQRLRTLRAEGLTYSQIALQFGVGRGAICSAVRRFVHEIVETTEERSARYVDRRQRKTNRVITPKHQWSDRALTETWAERKARLARERHA